MGNKYPDISHYHPVSNWSTVKKNVGFLISKATQGTNYVDTTLDDFIKGCEANGIPYWLYTYLNKGNEKAQAQFMVNTCKSKVGKNFIGYILDVEANNTPANVKLALDYINSLGVKTMLYTGYSTYTVYSAVISARGDNCAWWEARYGKNDGTYNSATGYCHPGVDLHQFTSKGTCDGVSGNCDLNRLTGTKSESWFTTPLTSVISEQTTTLELVEATLRNKYGSGVARKAALGDRYAEVQDMINHIAKATVSTLVTETKAGMYGNGDTRKIVLGNRYTEVQKAINAKSTPAVYYTVKSSDTLSKIAK